MIVSEIQSKKIEIKSFLTGSEQEKTLDEIVLWVGQKNEKINFICISMFGPLNLNKNSENYGQLINTPKLGWKNFNIVK